MTAEHPDEGTIHAWLDDALDAAESARIEAHVASCPACQATVAEARGLIAGASRVVRSLDGHSAAVSEGEGPAWGTPAAPAAAATSGSRWRTLRVTPGRAAVAATLLVVAGTFFTRDWIAHESIAPGVAVRAPAVTARDPLLDSAIRRNVEQAVPPRALDRAPGPDVLAAKPPAQRPVAAEESSALRVAEGRRAERALADSAPVAADVAGTRSSARAAMNVASAAPQAQVAVRRDVPVAPPTAEPAGTCIRVESATPGATWGSATLPMVVTLGGQGMARIAGADDVTGSWELPAPGRLRLDLAGRSGEVPLRPQGDSVTGTVRTGAAMQARKAAVGPEANAVTGRKVSCRE